MGCAESQTLHPDVEALTPLTVSPPAKLSMYEDKILLESEFTALRKNVTEAIHQTEVMKTQIDLYQSSLHPAEFESMRSKADDVADWMELDIRDGDRLVEVLMKVHPACKDVATQLLADSARLRRQEASIQDYLPYFQQRFDLLNRYWADIVTVWRDCDNHTAVLKADLAGRIGALEDFLGKKSDQLEALQLELRRLVKLDMHTFLSEQWTLARQIAVYSEQAALKKQRDVEAEKNRCVRLLQAELGEITRKYQSAVTTTEASRLESDSALRTSIERKQEAILEEFKAREKALTCRLEMQAEDLASHLLRHNEEKQTLELQYKGAASLQQLQRAKQTDSKELTLKHSTELTQDCEAKLATQRAGYEEKLAMERGSLADFQAKLQACDQEFRTKLGTLKADYADRERKTAETLLVLHTQLTNTQETEGRVQGELRFQLKSALEQVKRLEKEHTEQLRKQEEAETGRHAQLAEIKAQLKDLRYEYDSARRQLAKLTRETLEKDTLLADLGLQNAQNYRRIGELEKYADSLVIQLQEAHLVEESLRKSASFKPNPTQDSTLKRYLEALSLRDAKIKELIETQQDKESQYRAWTQRRTLRHVFTLSSGLLLHRKGVVWARWRSLHTFPYNFSLKGGLSCAFEQEIEWVFSQISAELLQTCQLVPIYDRAREQEQPLSPAQAFKLLENIVEQKYEADFGPFRTSTPQSFPDFALSLLTKAFQHAALAQQTLGQGLLALLQTDQPYAHLLCRLLHIGTREPYPVELGLVVERANAEFGKVEKRLGEGQRGGSAYLVHVVTSLYEIFGQDEASGAAVLRRLKPDTVSLPEFVSFNVCYCLAKTGLSAETVFASLDTPRSGDIPINELVQGLRNSLPIWLAEKDLKAAFTTIAQGRSSINQAGFSAFFDFKRYLQLAFTEPFTVSKCSFLIAIGDVYFLRERQIASELLHSLPTPTDLTQASFSQVIRKLDSEVDSERVALMWELADRYGQGQVTKRSALRALLACKVGPYASFAYYDARLDPSVLQVKERISAFSPELEEDLQR